MKIFLTFMAGCLIALSSFPQHNSVTLKVNGNKNKKVLVDGKTYTMTNTNPKANNKNITISGLHAGRHTIQVVRTTKAASTATTSFTLREGYDMTITINGSGAALLKEKRSAVTATVVKAMTPERFDELLDNVQDQWQAGAKLNTIQDAFANTANHFTTAQARQLIQLVDAEAGRLQLAKASYRSIIDPVNFSNIYPLLAEEASRNELSAYVKQYHNGTTTTTTNGAMNAASFNTLLKNIQDQWQASAKLTLITNTFANTANYFSAAQARQLIQQVDAEAGRLQLAKASYRSITDPANFTGIYSLLDNESSRNELSAYVNRYNNTTTTTAFDKLLQEVQNQWQASAKFNMVMNAFNGGHFFSAAQARQLIQTVDAESSRLQLAKASYKTITDLANFNIVAELIDGQTGRNDLAAYIRNGGEVPVVVNEPSAIKAMSDADFRVVLNEVNAQWIPGSKMQVLEGIFANTANYFSTPQVRQLVSFVSLEGNRLQLLKAAYRNTTDKTNFSSLYDLLPTQASRDALAVYVRG